MQKKKTILAIALAAMATGAMAVEWKGIEQENWIAGPKIKSPASLAGKVVLVDMWGLHCPPCRELLPRLEQIWESFHSKPFVLIGSHRQGRNDEAIKTLIEKAGVKYPIYQGAGLATGEPSSGGGIPFMYVVNHRGKVVYKGRSDREATEALVTAIGEVGRPPSLTGDVYIQKYKALAKSLVLGKPIASSVKKLEADSKSKNADFADEATKLLAAIENAKQETKEEIEVLKTTNPVEAVKMITLFKTTWPKDFATTYKDEMPILVAKAKAFKAEQAKQKK